MDLVDVYMEDQFHTHERLVNARMPILIMHGTSDMIIPHTQSERLIAQLISDNSAEERAVLELFDNVDHVSIVLHPKVTL